MDEANYFPKSTLPLHATSWLREAIIYTDSTSDLWAAVWLRNPELYRMAAAALQQFLPQNRQALVAASKKTAERLLVVPDPAFNVITIHAHAKDLGGAELNIYDSAGRVMDGHRRFVGNMSSVSFTMSMTEFPRDEYMAVLTTKDGKRIVDRFSV
jgi:hypothetical protein